MSSRFIQGEGYPILYRYDSNDILQTTINLPYVRDNQSSYIKQKFIDYPAYESREHKLLSGAITADGVEGHKLQVTIFYRNIESTILRDVYNAIILAQKSGYLKLKPRNDASEIYKVLYSGELKLESISAWQHNVKLVFTSVVLISSLSLSIPASQS